MTLTKDRYHVTFTAITRSERIKHGDRVRVTTYNHTGPIAERICSELMTRTGANNHVIRLKREGWEVTL